VKLIGAAGRLTFLLVGLAASSPVALAQGGASLTESGLVGTLEGPALLREPAAIPKSFGEAPMLAELVKAGKLPPVEQRLPAEPLVIQPLDEIGSYGGTWRRGFTGPGDVENANRINASDKLLFWDATGTKIMPSVARDWKLSEDGKTFTLYLRKGMKWSDGAPFTADDFVFWFEELYSNKEVQPTPIADMQPEGKPGRVVKVDETTVEFRFDVPYYLFEELMAGDTQIGGGQSARQSQKFSLGAYAPAHYLRQFMPIGSSLEQANAMAKEAGYESWVQHLHFKKDWSLNPELPTLGPWRTVNPINTPTWALERNPYYWAVDSAGNQLPYIDRVNLSLAENLEVLNLRAIAGQFDLQARHIDLGKLPTILENQEAGGYTVHLDLAYNGSDTTLYLNQSYDADPEIARLLKNVDFRRALSLGIDRDQLNEAFWLGVGTPGSPVPDDSLPQNPGPEWRTRWSTYDPAQANALLDKVGLEKKDAQGFRLRSDNGQRVRLRVEAVQAFLPWPKQAEMIVDQWRAIGIQAEVQELERNLAMSKLRNNESQITVWTNNGTEALYLFPRFVLPVEPGDPRNGPLYATWFASNGEQGQKPDDPELLRMFDLFRQASGQPEEQRVATAQEIWRIATDQVYSIGTVGLSPALMGVRLVSNKLGNIPARVCIAQHCRTPGGGHPETWFFKP
jgi:peptide/nickel transport system substrate-binding protein